MRSAQRYFFLLLLLSGVLRSADAFSQAGSTIWPSGSIWGKAGYQSNVNLSPPTQDPETARDSNVGVELKGSLGVPRSEVFSLSGRAEVQKYLEKHAETSNNYTLSAGPQYKYWSEDLDLTTTLSYRFSRTLSSGGYGEGGNQHSHTIRAAYQDQITSLWSMGLSTRYKLTRFRATNREDGYFVMGLEVSRQVFDDLSLGVEPSFEHTASDVDSSSASGPGLSLQAVYTPNDKLFFLGIINPSVKRYSMIAATDTTWLVILSADYALTQSFSVTAELSYSTTTSNVTNREYQSYNPLAGLEYHF